jgi:hypothetical protein
MKADLNATLRWLTVIGCVFAPFLIVVAALIGVPGGLAALNSSEPVEWIWLMLLGAMMLGIYYFLAVYLEDEEEISLGFRQLDKDHDGFISREDARQWPELSHNFERFDADHDGRLTRVDFEAFSHA